MLGPLSAKCHQWSCSLTGTTSQKSDFGPWGPANLPQPSMNTDLCFCMPPCGPGTYEEPLGQSGPSSESSCTPLAVR